MQLVEIISFYFKLKCDRRLGDANKLKEVFFYSVN